MIRVKKWNFRCNRVSGQYACKLRVLFPDVLGLFVSKKEILNVETQGTDFNQ